MKLANAAAIAVASAALVAAWADGGDDGPALAAGPCARPYSAASPWNEPIPATAPEHPQSAFHVGALQGRFSSDPTQFTYPVYEVSASTPLQTVSLRGWFSNVVNGGRTLHNQRGGTVRLPIPEGAQAAAGSDAQIILLDPATGDEWGASNLEKVSGGFRAWNAYHYNVRWNGVPPRDGSRRPFFLRGAGITYLAGLVRPCEIARGRIDHALAFAYDFPRPEFVYPATKSDGKSTDANDMPEGSRLQLDPAISEAEILSWGCKDACLTVARALQRYGMYLIDASGREKVMMEYEGTAHWGGVVNSRTVQPIPLSRFRLLAPCSLVGTAGHDTIRGTPERDVVCAREGNDRIHAAGGDDFVYAGLGTDRVWAQGGDDTVYARDGSRDVVDGGAGRDRGELDRVDRAKSVERR